MLVCVGDDTCLETKGKPDLESALDVSFCIWNLETAWLGPGPALKFKHL